MVMMVLMVLVVVLVVLVVLVMALVFLGAGLGQTPRPEPPETPEAGTSRNEPTAENNALDNHLSSTHAGNVQKQDMVMS